MSLTARPKTSSGGVQQPPGRSSYVGTATTTTAPSGQSSSSAAAAAKEKGLRHDPCLARSFRGHHGAVLSVAYSPVLVRAIDTKLPGYAPNTIEGASEGTTNWEIGGTVSSRARAQKAANSYVQQLASGGSDHVVMLWHLRPQLRAFRFLGHGGPVNAVAFSQDGSLLASASDDKTVRVWTPTAEGKSIVLKGHIKRVRSIAWASDKQWLLSSSDDQQCKLWDVNSGVAHSHFHGHTGSVTSCTFSPDMRLVATGSEDKTVKLFDLHNQSCIQTFYQNTGSGAVEHEVTCVKFHPFGNVLATGSADNSIKLWDTRNNQLLQHYSAHDLGVSSIDFHPSGNYLISTSLDSSIRLWDLRQGHQLYTIHGHPSPVNSAAFTPDGKSFVTGGDDQRVITWNVFLDNETTKNNRGMDKMNFGASLPQVGHDEHRQQQQRGALLQSQVAQPVHPNTGSLHRNSVQPGKRDAYYAATGQTSGPEFIAPEPSGPLPPTDMQMSNLPGRLSVRRKGPPSYTFKTGALAGQVIGPGSLYVDDGTGTPRPTAPEEINTESTALACDYSHTHLSLTTGEVHSYANQHDPAMLARGAQIQEEEEKEYAEGVASGSHSSRLRNRQWYPGTEADSLEEQLKGFQVPGMTYPAETGVSLTRSGAPGPSRGSDQSQSQPNTARSQHGAPSFAASAAGLQPASVQPSIARGSSSGQSLMKGNRDDYVYSYQSDRFVPTSAFPNQAQTAEVAALKNQAGVDIFAIPPADHIQRLPEQLAHTLKYMVTQLDQITRALNVFEYRMNLHEQKVDRLEQQQSRQLLESWN